MLQEGAISNANSKIGTIRLRYRHREGKLQLRQNPFRRFEGPMLKSSDANNVFWVEYEYRNRFVGKSVRWPAPMKMVLRSKTMPSLFDSLRDSG